MHLLADDREFEGVGQTEPYAEPAGLGRYDSLGRTSSASATL
jgi:hypothetical protein